MTRIGATTQKCRTGGRRGARPGFALLGAAAPILAALAFAVSAGAADLALHADLGIGGKYRTTSWIPVTVSVTNKSDQSYHGQIQVFSDAIGPQGQPSRSSQPSEIFAVSATIPPSQNTPLRFTLYTHDLDPTRDNFTVQFAEGDGGDGRVVAKIVSSANYHFRPFTGTPIPPGDLFVVGVGSDPIGAGFLSGMRLGLRHTPAGVETELKQPSHPNGAYPGAMAGPIRTPTLQSTAAQPGELPDSAAGYRGVDALLLGADATLDSLSDAQIQAIRQWTLSGGRLAVYGGPSAGSGGALPAPLQQLLPARFAGTGVPVTLPTGPAMAARMIPTSAAGVKTLQSAPDRTPLILSSNYGAGSVLMLAYDPTSEPFRQWSRGEAGRKFWSRIVTAPTSTLAYAMQREERGSGRFYGFQDKPRISDVVLHVPQLSAPGVWSVAIFLGVYIIVLVPLNYFILKKMDRREWAWVTIPALVVLVSAGAYGVGYAAKGGALFVNRATLIETSAGESEAAAYSGCGLFSSHRGAYDIDFSNPSAIASDPGPRQNDYQPWSSSGSGVSNYGGVRYLTTGSGTAVRGAGVNMWSMRTFDVQSTVDMGGAVDAKLRRDPHTGECAGTVANHTSYALDHCGVYWRGQFSPVNDLAPGAAAAVRTATHTRSILETMANRPPGADEQSGKSVDSSTAEMKRALAAFAVSTTQPVNANENDYGYGYDPESVRTQYLQGADEALFVGWSTDNRLSGPPLKVDGQPATQNDVTLVIIHIPVR